MKGSHGSAKPRSDGLCLQNTLALLSPPPSSLQTTHLAVRAYSDGILSGRPAWAFPTALIRPAPVMLWYVQHAFSFCVIVTGQGARLSH